MNLVLVSTPFQALVAASVLKAEGADAYDLVYSARTDVPAHRHYFAKLASGARHAAYAADVDAPTAVLRHALRRLRLRRFFASEYDTLFLANVDSLLYRDLVGRHRRARIVTFDDGAANVFTSSQLHRTASPAERRAGKLLGIPTIDAVRDRIAVHHSVYPGFDNIVEAARIAPIALFDAAGRAPAQQGVATFFLGQPYEEAQTAGTLDARGVEKLRAWLAANPVDYYLAHPREAAPLSSSIRVERSPDVAEEQIFVLAGDARPRLFGWFTSVLLNVPAAQADKVYLSVGDGPSEAERIRLMQRAGCSIHHV
ncbi:glycosyltransferase family 52 [Lysobacter sp. 2RAF19]